MPYTITNLGPRDHAIHIDGKYIGAVSLFTDGWSRGKPVGVYWLANRDSFDVFHLSLDAAVQSLVHHHYRDVAKAGKPARNAAAYRAGSSLG